MKLRVSRRCLYIPQRASSRILHTTARNLAKPRPRQAPSTRAVDRERDPKRYVKPSTAPSPSPTDMSPDRATNDTSSTRSTAPIRHTIAENIRQAARTSNAKSIEREMAMIQDFVEIHVPQTPQMRPTRPSTESIRDILNSKQTSSCLSVLSF